MVFVAENLNVLHRVLALKLVAQRSPTSTPKDSLEELRQALIEERWGDAVERWITLVDVAVDVYDDLDIWNDAMLGAETVGFELQFTPLFKESGP